MVEKAKRLDKSTDDTLDNPDRNGIKKSVSEIRAKYDRKILESINDQIKVFPREKDKTPKAICEQVSDLDSYALEREAEVVDQSVDILKPGNDERVKYLVLKHCGKVYLDLLESGNPLARFWVQLKVCIEVIPTEEYLTYIGMVLGKEISDDIAYGNNRMREEFMRKFGFKTDQDVVDYLMKNISKK